jgi:hypothetical protein
VRKEGPKGGPKDGRKSKNAPKNGSKRIQDFLFGRKEYRISFSEGRNTGFPFRKEGRKEGREKGRKIESVRKEGRRAGRREGRKKGSVFFCIRKEGRKEEMAEGGQRERGGAKRKYRRKGRRVEG